jgi:hypothetical protein
MTPCYCAACKKELPVASISDEDAAWCPDCRRVVDMSWFQLPSWITALLLVLAVNADLLVG